MGQESQLVGPIPTYMSQGGNADNDKEREHNYSFYVRLKTTKEEFFYG